MDKQPTLVTGKGLPWWRRLCALALVLGGCTCRAPASSSPAPTEPAPGKVEQATQVPRGVRRIPLLPPLPSGASGCVVRRWNGDDDAAAWRQQVIGYDAATRTLDLAGLPLRFDARGRLATRGSSEEPALHTTHVYDAHGNLREATQRRDGEIAHRARWEIRYEGKQPRVTAQRMLTSAGDSSAQEYAKSSYRYGADGRLAEETLQWAGRHPFLRKFSWSDGRLTGIDWVREPRIGDPELAYDAAERFSYDRSGRLIAHARDGDMHGEETVGDGRPDEVLRYIYDAAGNLERFERDGRLGDVAAHGPDGAADEIALFSAPCEALGKLWPELVRLPDLQLPSTLQVRWR